MQFIIHLNKMSSTSNRHRISKSQSHSLKMGTQSSSKFLLRSGMRINTVAETMQHIKQQRVKSYQKISFSIRKMDQLFKPKIDNPEEQKSRIINRDIHPKHNIAKVEKLKTCMNFFDSIKFKKNIINQPGLMEKQPIKNRIKTEHHQDDCDVGERQRTFSNLHTFRHKSPLLPVTTSILKTCYQEDEIMEEGIPGVKFKNKDVSPVKSEEKDIFPKTRIGSLKKSMEKLSVMTKTKASSYLHADELLERDADQRVQTMYNLRRQQQLFEEPKQWQFYNCLKLSQLSLCKFTFQEDRSDLKLSCENWVLLDYLELKYIRGWSPKQEKQTKIAIVLLITSILMDLESKRLDCHRLKIRINNSIVEKKMPKQLKDYRSLQNNTILSLWDLFIGVVYSNDIDSIWQIIYTLAYIHKNYNIHVEDWAENIEQYNKYIFIEDTSQLKQFEVIFVTLCQQVCSKLNLTRFSIQNRNKKVNIKSNKSFGLPIKTHQQIKIKCSCVQLAILFMECIKFPSFLELFTNPNLSIRINIRYQVGFHYWQDRTHDWLREWHGTQSNYYLVGKNSDNCEFSAICYNKNEEVIAIINDSKPNMVVCDFQSIFRWMRASVRRFNKPQIVKQ